MQANNRSSDNKKNPALFKEDYYNEVEFTKINFTEGKTGKIEFYKCIFTSCLFIKAVFEKCVFEKCTFLNCDLSVVKFIGSSFIDVKFVENKMIGIDWTIIQKPSRFNFLKCILNDSSFYKMDLRSTQIEECIAHNSDLENTDLSKTNCRKTDFLNAKFGEADLSYADFTGAINYSINPNKTKLKKAKFSLPEAVSLLDVWGVQIDGF